MIIIFRPKIFRPFMLNRMAHCLTPSKNFTVNWQFFYYRLYLLQSWLGAWHYTGLKLFKGPKKEAWQISWQFSNKSLSSDCRQNVTAKSTNSSRYSKTKATWICNPQTSTSRRPDDTRWWRHCLPSSRRSTSCRDQGVGRLTSMAGDLWRLSTSRAAPQPGTSR